MNDIFICNNPGLLRFTKRQNAAEQGAATYLNRITTEASRRFSKQNRKARKSHAKRERRKRETL